MFLRLVVFLGLPAICAVVTYRYLQTQFFAPLDPAATEARLIEVEPGWSFARICNAIEEGGVLRAAWALELLARLSKVDTSIKAGEYQLSPAMSPREILAVLSSGQVYQRRVLVREGDSLREIAVAVAGAGLLAAEDFLAATKDKRLLVKAGIQGPTFEGFLFPETYFFSRPITPEAVLWRMLEEGEQRWNPNFDARSRELQLSRPEILTLASIIQKEAGNEDEMPLISSVFHNRLKQGMRLQADPTVIYGIENFDGNIRKSDLQLDHPYNTYVYPGLPPGPIASPGEAAIRAALFPAETTYLFFVSDGNGRHVFSTTLAEHNEAVNKYQRGRG